MSHEGIRITTAEQAARQSEADAPRLTGDAIRPAKGRVDRTGGTGMAIDWRDGHSSRWSFAWLRAACPCATCHEERDADGRPPAPQNPNPHRCCRSTKPRPLRSRSPRSVTTPSASSGTTATKPASTPGTTSATSATRPSAALRMSEEER